MVNYALHYFNGRGRAEISRMIFAYAGVQYKDDRIEDWPNTKKDSPIGQVPYLEIDDLKLPQSLSIARYLAREYNLVGQSNLDAAKADAVVDTCIDLMTAFYYKVFMSSDAESKKLALDKFLKDDAIKGLENTAKLICMYGGENGYSVGNSLTWADLFVHGITFELLNYQANILDNFPTLQKVRSLVEKNENIAKYLKERPVTPF